MKQANVAKMSMDNFGHLLTEDQTQVDIDWGRNQRNSIVHQKIETKANVFMFFAFGIALLLPWNATMAAMDYYIEKFPNYKPSFSFLMAVSIPMLGMQLVSFVLQKVISMQLKLVSSLGLNAFIAFLLSILPSSVHTESTCYYIILFLMILQGCGIAFMQGALYGMAGISMKLTTNLMVGIGVGSVSMNVLRIILLASLNEQDSSAIVFFSVACGYLLLCTTLAIIFIRRYNKVMKELELVDTFVLNNTDDHKSRLDNSQYVSARHVSFWRKSLDVYRINYPFALTVAFTYTIQYSFFPGVILTHKLSFVIDFSWFAIGMITLQNVFDTIGRSLAGIKQFQFENNRAYFIMCFSRVIFIVTYILFYKGIAPEVFQSDAFAILNLTLFSITCGYLATIGMQLGTSQLTGDQGLAGTIMGFHITLGISIGSLIAWIGFS